MNVFKLIEDNGLELHGDIEYFAELIRQDERNACATMLEADARGRGNTDIGALLAYKARLIRERDET